MLNRHQGWQVWGPIFFVLEGSCATDLRVAARRSVLAPTTLHETSPSAHQDAVSPVSTYNPPKCTNRPIHGGEADSELLMIFNTIDDLNGAIRTDSPETRGSPVQDPCVANSHAEWGEYHAPEVNWYYSCTGGKIVAGRRSKEGDSQEKELYLQSRGRFAIAFLAKADFLCPKNPEEHCYSYEAPEGCETDFSIPCTPEGQEGIVEVLDVANRVVHRLDDVRHVRNWSSSLVLGDRLRLTLDHCVIDL